MSREILPALGLLPPWAGHATLHPGVRPDQPDTPDERPGHRQGPLPGQHRPQAEAMFRQPLQVENLPARDRARLAAALQKLSNPEPQKKTTPDTR